MTDAPNKRQRREYLKLDHPTDIEIRIKTESTGLVSVVHASRWKLAESCTYFRDAFKDSESKTFDWVVPLGYDESAELLLEFLLTKYGDTSIIETHDFPCIVKLAKLVEDFKVQHKVLEDFLATSAKSFEEAEVLACACPLLAQRHLLIKHLAKNARYTDFFRVQSFAQLCEMCEEVDMKVHKQATLQLKWFAAHPENVPDFDANQLSGTYIRGVLLPYALKYPHIAKQFADDITSNLMKARFGDDTGMEHGMIWGIPLKHVGRSLAVDLEWLGLTTLKWGNDDVVVTVNGAEQEPGSLPMVFEPGIISFTD